MDAAGVFVSLRCDIEAAETALDSETLDYLKLAAHALPGYPVAGSVASTAHEGALHAARATYAALWTDSATGAPTHAEILNPPGAFRARQKLWFQKLLAGGPVGWQRQYWARVREFAGLFDIPANLAAGIEAEWAAARRALAADALPPVEQPGASNGQAAARGNGTLAAEKPTATVNARMLELVQRDLERVRGWTTKQWATELRCARSSVVKTRVWQDLAIARDRQRAEKAADRRRRKRPPK